VTQCGFISSSTRGAWYLLQGNGRCYSASTDGSAINTLLSIYDATAECEGLSCLRERLYYNETLHWKSTAGIDYYILVADLSAEFGQYRLIVSVRHDVWTLL